MGKSTISMAMFNSYVTNYQRVNTKNSVLTPIFKAVMAVTGQMADFQFLAVLPVSLANLISIYPPVI